MQLVLPSLSAIFPGGQGVHSDGEDLNVPLRHRHSMPPSDPPVIPSDAWLAGQASQLVLPVCLAIVPVGQEVHLTDPGEAANVPRGHFLHPSPVLPDQANKGALPAGQGVQSATEVASGLEIDGMNSVPAGHLKLGLLFPSCS